MPEKTLLEKLRPSRGGAMVVAGLIAFGGIILGGLYLSPAAKPPALPANTPVGVPERKLRFVCYDLHRQHPGMDPMFSQIAKLEPDYVFLLGVEEDDAVEAAEALQMQQTFHPRLYQRSEHLAGPKGTWGNLILSRQLLYAAAPLGGKRGGFGVGAMSVVDGRWFYVACLHFSPGEAGVGEEAEWTADWKSHGSPPTVAAVIYSDSKPSSANLFSFIEPGGDGQWFELTPEWAVAIKDHSAGAGRGRSPVWVDLTPASIDKAATRRSALNSAAE